MDEVLLRQVEGLDVFCDVPHYRFRFGGLFPNERHLTQKVLPYVRHI
jgi:hypothetical protein